MPRITRISGSLAIVLIAYWAYALLAVPWIEPPAAPPPPPGTVGKSGQDDDILKQQMDQIRPLFKPGDWEVAGSTKMLESERAKLLFQKYRNLGGGKVKIEPCTIVVPYEGDAENEDQRIRQSIVLQTIDDDGGAILQFDRDLDLTPTGDAKLQSGQLIGKIVIRSDWKQPGPEDDLLITTKNIHLTKQSISTAERVDFSWGPHFGSGQDMEIKLLPGRSGTAGMDVGGIESFELRHVDRLHLELGQDSEKLFGPASKEAEKGTGPICAKHPPGGPGKLGLSPFPPSADAPVEIACSGPFHFDAVRRVAIFHDNVRVVKSNPAGPEKGTGPICAKHPPGGPGKLDLTPFPAKLDLSPFPAVGEPDTIACDLLSLWFIERPKDKSNVPAAKTAKTGGSLDLTPERFEAVGNPVVVTAPGSNVIARAKRIEYNLLSKSIALDGDQPVFLQQGPNEIHARSLHYQADEDENRLGQLVSQGPGYLRGQAPEQPGQQLEAVWRDELRIQPSGQYKVISLTGGAELKSPGIGQLQAKTIFIWLTETPSVKDNKKFDLQPHELSASDDVRFGSPRLSGKVDQLEVWFEQVNGLAAASTRRPEGMGGSPPITASDGSAVQRLPPPAQSHFEVAGRRLRARVLLPTGADPALSDLTIEDNVQLLETQTAQPGDQPVLIRGNHLDVVKAYAPDAVATIVGQPAHFEGQGMGLTGAAIKLDRGTNHLSIDGPGQMDITTTNDLEGKPLPAPCKLTVDWQRRMDFDGRTARFEQSVVASTPGMFSKGEMRQFRLNTSTMDVQLQRPISFSDSKTHERPQVEEIRCNGGVAVDSHSFDARQQLVSHDRMQVTDLAINLNPLGGGLTGGYGWINTVRYASDDMLPGGPNASNNAPAKPDQLYCLYVKFDRDIRGNVLFQQATFRDNVRATYAPVDSWDAMVTTNDPSRLGPKGAVASCDELRVHQMLLPVGGRRAIELYASGNAQVEGAEYKALGSQITYAQAKGILIIEGDGHIPAELFQQKQAGAPAKHISAQRFRYNLRTKEPEADGVQMLEVPLPGGKKM